MMRQFRRAVGTGLLVVRSICAVRSRRIHGGRGVGSALAERELGFLSAEVSWTSGRGYGFLLFPRLCIHALASSPRLLIRSDV
jgi:hypothetical protein